MHTYPLLHPFTTLTCHNKINALQKLFCVRLPWVSLYVTPVMLNSAALSNDLWYTHLMCSGSSSSRPTASSHTHTHTNIKVIYDWHGDKNKLYC